MVTITPERLLLLPTSGALTAEENDFNLLLKMRIPKITWLFHHPGSLLQYHERAFPHGVRTDIFYTPLDDKSNTRNLSLKERTLAKCQC